MCRQGIPNPVDQREQALVLKLECAHWVAVTGRQHLVAPLAVALELGVVVVC